MSFDFKRNTKLSDQDQTRSVNQNEMYCEDITLSYSNTVRFIRLEVIK